MSDVDGDLVDAVRSLRGVFRDGLTDDLVVHAYTVLGVYLPFQPFVVWDSVTDSGFFGDSEHFAEVGAVVYDLPGPLWNFLTVGSGEDPATWDFRPHRVARVAAVVSPVDPTGLNRVRR